MTPTQLTKLGERIYGPGWQSALARDLGKNDRTVRRWLAGDFNIPDTIVEELDDAIAKRIEHLSRIREKLGAKQ